MPGVTQIINDIKVESGMISDDEIRHKAARLIYNDPFYRPFSKEPGPPIHIIVNRGYVTLEGSVDSQMQADRATQAIYAVANAFNVENHLQIEGE